LGPCYLMNKKWINYFPHGKNCYNQQAIRGSNLKSWKKGAIVPFWTTARKLHSVLRPGSTITRPHQPYPFLWITHDSFAHIILLLNFSPTFPLIRHGETNCLRSEKEHHNKQTPLCPPSIFRGPLFCLWDFVSLLFFFLVFNLWFCCFANADDNWSNNNTERQERIEPTCDCKVHWGKVQEVFSAFKL